VRGRRDNNHRQVNFKSMKESTIKSDIVTGDYSIKNLQRNEIFIETLSYR